MRVLVVDNYDSFTYNLVHLLEELGAEVLVRAERLTDGGPGARPSSRRTRGVTRPWTPE